MIRPGEPADLPRLREIQRQALAEPWPELLAAAVDGPLSVPVVDVDSPVGYAVVVADGESVAYVPELAVDPARQREGHGTRLLAALRERLTAAGYDQLRVTVLADDDGARAFYADRGFDRLDRLDGHFERGDGLLLALALGTSEA
ncbi:MAG: N-acetyltransferase [Halobacteriales archaeon SW_9_67_25]|nr:MAG: N-acetyltransferase [Halobacteriales archaeon SW_9_67_25]